MRRSTLLLLTVSSLSATLPPLKGRVWYEPLAARPGESVKLHAEFTDVRGIQAIMIESWVGPIGTSAPQDSWIYGLPWRDQLPTWEEVKVCHPPGAPSTAKCEVEKKYAEGDLVTVAAWYIAQGEEGFTEDARDRTIRQALTFAVGDPSAHPGIVWPLAWHRSEPPSRKIDLGFTAPPRLFNFGGRVREVLRQTFAPDDDFTKLLRERWDDFNFWLLPPVSSYDRREPCRFWLYAEKGQSPKAVDPARLSYFMDGVVLVHEQPVVDCGSLDLGYGGNGRAGRGSVFTHWDPMGARLDSRSGRILAHEMGHFLFEQSDEYDKTGSYDPDAVCANVRAEEGRCQRDLVGRGVVEDSPQCSLFEADVDHLRLWRSLLGKGASELMETSPFMPPVGKTSWGAISEQCLGARFGWFGERGSARQGVEKSTVPGGRAEPPVPSGVPGVVVVLRTCRSGGTYRMEPFSSASGASDANGVWKGGCAEEGEETAMVPCADRLRASTRSGAGEPAPAGAALLGRKALFIAETLKSDATSDPREARTCGTVLEKTDREVRTSREAGPLLPRLAVEGRGLLTGEEGLQVVASFEIGNDVQWFCFDMIDRKARIPPKDQVHPTMMFSVP